jgi:hypothetical protein
MVTTFLRLLPTDFGLVPPPRLRAILWNPSHNAFALCGSGLLFSGSVGFDSTDAFQH